MTNNETSERLCPACGSRNDFGAKRCASCGATSLKFRRLRKPALKFRRLRKPGGKSCSASSGMISGFSFFRGNNLLLKWY